MPGLIQAMRERRNELRKHLCAFPEFREYELLKQFIKQYETVAVPHPAARRDDEQWRAQPTRGRRRRGNTVADAAEAVIKEVGRPISIADVFNGLSRYGQMVTGKRPIINLSSTLSKDQRFRSIPWGGKTAWWLVGIEAPPEPVASGGASADARAPASDNEEEAQMRNGI